MKSPIQKRSVLIKGFKTTVSLESEFWDSLKEIAAVRGLSLTKLVTQIAAGRDPGNLSSAIRVYVLQRYRGQSSDYGPSATPIDE